MKQIFLITVVLLFLACERDKCELCACGVNNPATELQWLKELIDKAENDNSINYRGHIYSGKYKDRDVFISDMSMGSGGIAYYYFNCDGTNIIFTDDESPVDVVIYKEKIIYSNVPY